MMHFLRYGTFKHSFHNGRDAKGHLIHVCAACGKTRAVLSQPVKVDGPAHHQQPDLGARTTKAVKVRSGNVIQGEFDRVSER